MNKLNDSEIKNKIADSVNKLKNILVINDKFLFLEENKEFIYTTSKGLFISEEDNRSRIKKVILSDSVLELKVIKVPVVAHNLLKNIVINTVKKVR